MTEHTGRFALVLLLAAAAPAAAQPAEGLAPYFGFEPTRILVSDEECGPAIAADFNGDGLPDLAVVNNRKSRIDLFYLRATQRSESEMSRATRVNELPPNPWYDTEKVSVAHRVTALRAFDVDGDGKLDLVYAGANPLELVVMRQETPSKFEMLSRTRVRDLAARRDGFEIADVSGDARPEVLAVVGGRIQVFPMDARGRLGEPITLGSSGLQQLYVEDYNGDGRADVLGVVPEDAAPLRLWLQTQDPGAADKRGMLAAELRFELPPLITAEPVRFPGRDAASIAVLERASRRLVFFDLTPQAVAAGGADPGVLTEREVQAEVAAFADGASKNRSVVLADLDMDGDADLLTTDVKANSIVLYRQQAGIGLARGESFSAFKAPKSIEVGEWDGQTGPEVFVLSEEEKAVGIAAYDADEARLTFPEPVAFQTAGATPIAMRHASLGGAPALVVLLKDRRDYVLEVHWPAADSEDRAATTAKTIALKDVKRDPGAILPFDADRDGITDLLLLTPGEPMMMVRFAADGDSAKPAEVLTKDQMPQFGLVQAAGPENTAILDLDGDGHEELLIADANFVRGAAFDPAKGWRVVDQINTLDNSAQLVGLTLMAVPAPPGMAVKGAEPAIRIVAADKANGRLLIMDRNEAGRFTLRERVRLLGFPVGTIRAGSFTGDGREGVLAIGDDSFALVRLAGTRPGLEQFAAYRSDAEDRLEHFVRAGDINGDGYTDLVLLDAKEQICQILTFSAARKVHPATEFKVFESRLFGRGDTREFQPSMAIVQDLTGDGAADLGLLVHDRVLVYPQKTAD